MVYTAWLLRLYRAMDTIPKILFLFDNADRADVENFNVLALEGPYIQTTFLKVANLIWWVSIEILPII